MMRARAVLSAAASIGSRSARSGAMPAASIAAVSMKAVYRAATLAVSVGSTPPVRSAAAPSMMARTFLSASSCSRWNSP